MHGLHIHRIKHVNHLLKTREKKKAQKPPPFKGLILLGQWIYSVDYVVPVATHILYHNAVEGPNSLGPKVRIYWYCWLVRN